MRILITSKACAPCDSIKKFINKKEIDVDIIDIVDEKAEKYLKEYSIRAVPSLIEKGKVFTGLGPIMEELIDG